MTFLGGHIVNPHYWFLIHFFIFTIITFVSKPIPFIWIVSELYFTIVKESTPKLSFILSGSKNQCLPLMSFLERCQYFLQVVLLFLKFLFSFRAFVS